jgi:RNA-directed DNA polymerase
MRSIAERLAECGLTMHPEKSKIVYCQDSNRTESFPHVQFTFLGFTFRPRKAMSKQHRVFTSFLPGVSADAVKRMRKVVRGWRIPRQTPATLAELAEQYNSVLRGWWNTTELSIKLRCESSFDTSIGSLSSGPDASIRRCRGTSGAAWNGSPG